MTKKLYVGNLSYGTTVEELKKLFSEVGPVVSATIIMDRATGQSKGFGFVEMDSVKAAQDAIAKYNNYEMNRRNITVSEARPPKENGGGGGYGGGSRVVAAVVTAIAAATAVAAVAVAAAGVVAAGAAVAMATATGIVTGIAAAATKPRMGDGTSVPSCRTLPVSTRRGCSFL